MKLCLKELRESWRWLRLAEKVPLAPSNILAPILKETDELIRIFVASINTVKTRKKS